jgi:DeoR/GlpR family transcriptional regulator of sugar metabolism
MDQNVPQDHLLTEQRRQLILERIQELGVVKTSELSELFAVSQMTIRNDLNALNEQGTLRRIHGGAMVPESLAAEPSYHDKADLNRTKKERIGRRAAALVQEGTAIFIGNGTTTMQLVKHLSPNLRVRVFTNALNHAMELTKKRGAEVYVIGGYLRGISLAMVGRLARQALAGVYFDLAFLGVNGISLEHGYTLPSLEEAETAAEVVRHARRTVILADHTKFGVITHSQVMELSDGDMIITDSGVSSNFSEAFGTLGVELCTA